MDLEGTAQACVTGCDTGGWKGQHVGELPRELLIRGCQHMVLGSLSDTGGAGERVRGTPEARDHREV